jgi:hypothetical protein
VTRKRRSDETFCIQKVDVRTSCKSRWVLRDVCLCRLGLLEWRKSQTLHIKDDFAILNDLVKLTDDVTAVMGKRC